MDSDTLKFLRNLSGSAKETLIQICLVYPDTESVRSDIERAATLKTTIRYENLSADFDRIVTEMNGKPKICATSNKGYLYRITQIYDVARRCELDSEQCGLYYISTD